MASSADGSKLVAVVENGQSLDLHRQRRQLGRAPDRYPSNRSKLVLGGLLGRRQQAGGGGVRWPDLERQRGHLDAARFNRAWTLVASSADGSKLVAAVENGQVWTSIDSGVNWDRAPIRYLEPVDIGRRWPPRPTAASWWRWTEERQDLHLDRQRPHLDSTRESDRDWRSVASSADGSKLVAFDAEGRRKSTPPPTAASTGQKSASAGDFCGGQWPPRPTATSWWRW